MGGGVINVITPVILQMLEIAEDSFVMKNLENALVWRSRSASIKGKH